MAQQFDLKFDKDGLIPAIVVDSISKKVLTLAYMNEQSLEISLEKGLTCFFSRSRQQLWLKGETSGNYQHIVSIITDCDRDALLVTVEKDGPACHTRQRVLLYRQNLSKRQSVRSSASAGFTNFSKAAKGQARGLLHHLPF